MKEGRPKIYEKYPFWMVVVVNILMLAVYVAGAYIMFKLNLITGILYVIYFLILEFQLYKEACTSCCLNNSEISSRFCSI